MIQIMGLEKVPIIKEGDNLVEIILEALEQMGLTIEEKDILVVTQKIVSQSEGCLQDLSTITPSKEAVRIDKIIDKDPRLITLMVGESRKVLRTKVVGGIGKIIVELKSGWYVRTRGLMPPIRPRIW